MKLLVCDKRDFGAWLIAGSDKSWHPSERPLDVEKLSHIPFKQNLEEIETPSQEKIGDLIRQITGKPPVIYYRRDGSVTSEFDFGEVSRAEGWSLYCTQATTEALDPERTLSDYDIQDGGLLLIDQWSAHYDLVPCIQPVPRVKDFFEIALTKDDISGDSQQQTQGTGRLNEGYSYGRKAIMLYSDEDFELSKYVRYNFASLDKLTGSILDLFVIEQPTRTDGISAREYWKERLATNTYTLMHRIGLTKYKPYDKADSYVIAEKLGLLPEALPCVVLFRELASDEKIVITLSKADPDSLREFFRRLVSVVQRAQDSVYEGKTATLEKPSLGSRSWEQLDLSQFDSIKDPVERGKAKSAAYLAYLNSDEAAHKKAREQAVQDAWSKAEKAARTDFTSFRNEFIKQWEVSQEQASSSGFLRWGKEVSDTNYVFHGNTVFINKPEGSVEVKDFQKGDK